MDRPDPDRSVNAQIKVMIVDDDLIARRTLADLLSGHPDIDVIGVYGSGQEALTATHRQPPDLLLADVSMPGMGGAELTRLIRGKHPRIHVLACTSLADEQSISDMLNAGAAGVVYKDSSVGAVADAIRATVAGLSVLSPRFSRRLARPELDEPLTPTEINVLHFLSRGWTNEQIGAEIELSASAVKYHIAKLTERLGANNRVTLAVAAVRLGFDSRLPR